MRQLLTTASLVVLLALPATAPAQIDLDVRLTPEIGLLTPADWFYYEVTVLGQGPMEWTESAVLRSTTLGLTASVDLADSGLWLRGHVARTVGGETYLAYSVLREPLPNPPEVVRTQYWLPSSITMAGMDLGFPTRLQLPLDIQPYFTVGIGAKHYTFDLSPLADNDRVVAPEEGTVLMGRLGAGVVVPLGSGLGLDLQVLDALSEYWDEDLQHDVLWTAGLSWQPF